MLGTGPLPHPATHTVLSMGGRVGRITVGHAPGMTWTARGAVHLMRAGAAKD